MIFTLRQLQEKCREQKHIVFVDLTKAFDFFMRRKDLFKLLEKLECPQKLLRLVSSFQEDMKVKGTVLCDRSSSAVFPIQSGVKQGCVLAPTLFGIFFSLLLLYAFSESEDGVFLHTRSDGKLFNLSRLRAKSTKAPAARNALRRRRCPGLPHKRRTAGLSTAWLMAAGNLGYPSARRKRT